jgi:hypothetical protein
MEKIEQFIPYYSKYIIQFQFHFIPALYPVTQPLKLGIPRLKLPVPLQPMPFPVFMATATPSKSGCRPLPTKKSSTEGMERNFTNFKQN